MTGDTPETNQDPDLHSYIVLSWHPTTLLSIDSAFAVFLTFSAAGAAGA